MNEFEKYFTDVYDGRITACDKMKKQAHNLLRAYACPDKYHFDYDIANKLGISPMEAAKYMILSAKNAGIHAVKFQTYKADQLASKHSPSYWDTNEEPSISQYKLFKKFDSFEEKE